MMLIDKFCRHRMDDFFSDSHGPSTVKNSVCTGAVWKFEDKDDLIPTDAKPEWVFAERAWDPWILQA